MDSDENVVVEVNRNVCVWQNVQFIREWRNGQSMNRELDGCYFRIMRDGIGQSVCFTDLTREERKKLLADKDTQFLKNLCCYLADRILELRDIIDEQAHQLECEEQ